MIDRRTFLGGLAVLALRVPGPKDPAEILIIRHGEEPQSGPHLNDRGRARAEALPRLFPRRFVTPTVLIAARSSRESSRPVETIEPLSARLHISIDDEFPDDRFDKLAAAVLSKSQYAGAHILICWHHATIPNLAAALGVNHPPSWPSRQYDHLWRLQFKGRGATCVDEPQQLLPGDSGMGRGTDLEVRRA